LETRTKILNLIKNNSEELFTSIKKSDYKSPIEFILKQFIGDNSYNYYNKKYESIIKSNQSHNISQPSNNFGSNLSYLNILSDVEVHENENIEYEDDFYYPSPFRPSSPNYNRYLEERSKRSLDFDFEDEDYDENELVYKILNNSKFSLHTNKKGKTPFIIYDEIKLFKKENENIIETETKTIDEIRNATTKNDQLLNNYKKFLSFLDKFETILSNDFINNYKLKITLNFETQNINNYDFIITCLYDLEIPGEDLMQFKDDNILANGLKDGFSYMLNEINSSDYS
jgi:Icc-related predicted phosphoesterase